MGALYEPRQSKRSSRGVGFAAVTLLCSVLAFLIISPFAPSELLRFNKTTIKPHHVQPSPPTSQNQTAQELLEDSLSLLRDLLINIAEKSDSSSSSTPESKSKLGARDIISDFTGLFSGFGKGIGGSSNASGFAGASKYLGVGIGNGTLQGLSLNSKYLQENKVVEPASGINSIAENLGQGLSSSIVGSVNASALLPSTPDSLNEATKSFAQGLGSGAASGLNMKAEDPNAFNTTGLNGIVGNFGQGLSSSFLGGVDIQKMLTMATGNISNAQTNAATLAAAQGLGSGAAYALKLTTVPPTNASFNTDGLNGIAGNMGQGLSTTFLQNVNLSQMLSGASSMLPKVNILEAAQGLGSGLGEGSVVGLGIQPASAMPMSAFQNINTSNPSAGPVVEMFARGLSQSFLQNGTAFKLISLVGGNTSFKLDTQKVATGFGVGLVDGAQTSIQNAGGVGALLSMTPEQMVGMMALPTTSNFDDSVGGAAVGFGNGLGYEVTKGLLQMFGKPALSSNFTSTNMNGTTILNSTSALKLRNRQSNHFKHSSPVIYGRQAVATNTTTPSKLNTMMLATTLDPILQMGSEALGCQGIGGLAAIFVSLSKSKALSGGKLGNLTSAFGSLTNQTYTTHDTSGNTFTINIGKALLTVNGNSLKKDFDLTIVHLAFASLAYVVLIPILLLLTSLRHIALLTGRTYFLPALPKIRWLITILLLLPCMGGTFAFGFLGEGNRNHFYSPHGIMGLILLVLTLLALPLAYIRSSNAIASMAFKINVTAILLLTIVELMTGFVDLSTISSCLFQFLPQVIFVGAGFLFAIPIFTATTLMGLEVLLKKWLSSGVVRLGSRGDDREKLLTNGEGKKERVVISRPVRVDGKF